MVHLLTASSPFHAQVIGARLGAEGIVTQTRGNDATWPFPSPVDVFVEAGQLGAASALLLADRAEAGGDDDGGGGCDRPLRRRARPVRPWVIGAVTAAVTIGSFGGRWF